MLAYSHVLALLYLSCYFNHTTSYQSSIYIDGVQGNDSVACLLRGPHFPCRTLNYAFQNPQGVNNNMRYTLSVGIHYLNASIEFNGRQNIAIVGNGSSYDDTNVVCTNEEGGLKFNKSSFLLLERFSLTNCSFNTEVNHTNSNWYNNRAAVFFYECHGDYYLSPSISISDVRISHSRNATALVILDTRGQIVVTNSVFDHNGPVGRGIHVHTSTNFTLQQNVSYQFINCSIKDNSVKVDSESKKESCVPLNRQNQTYSYGGGMSVVLQNNGSCYAIELKIVGTNFIGNKAQCGGGLFLAIEYNSINNSIGLKDCLFENNICPKYSEQSVTFGGGIRLEHLNTDSTNGQNQISIQDCQLRNNSAFSGGGLSISPLAHTDTVVDLLVIKIENTHFVENSGNVGAAIQVSLVALRVQTKPPKFFIANSTFHGNIISVKDYSDVYQNGMGAVYTNQIPITFYGRVLFVHNQGTALAVVGTYLLFNNCTANFTNNFGAKGGAIALLGAADMVTNNETKMFFIRNHATLYGGAIFNTYIEQENLIAYFNCFVRPTKPFRSLDEWTTTFTFRNNLADMNGSSIFTTSALPCLVKSQRILCSDSWKYFRNGQKVDCEEEISTEPGHIQKRNLKLGKIKTIPGQITNLKLSITDDFCHDLSQQTVFAARMQPESQNILVDDQFRFVSNQEIMIDGVSGSHSYLHLHTIGNRAWHLHIPVELQECPPGFVLSKQESSYRCKCFRNRTFSGTLECDPEQFESHLSSGYWMGYLNENENNTQQNLVVSFCPPGFCASDSNTIPVSNATSRKKFLCFNREDILCSKCIAEYGPAVNSDELECVVCKEEDLGKEIAKYIFTVYAPLLILFSLMIIFGVRLTTGPANAFIFYSQVISSNFDIDADGHIKHFSKDHFKALKRAYKVPYGILNLEFIENLLNPFCISSKLNALDVFQLDYLVALTPLAMIIIVLVCFKLKRCCVRVAPTQVTTTARSFWARQKSGEYLLDAFAAFVLLSYTKFGLISAFIIKRNPVFNATGELIEPDLIYFAGHYNMADKLYLVRYFFPACFVLIVIALPPLFLLGYPVILLEKCLMRFHRLWKYYPVDKVHILLDIFQSCYKDDRRFFAGLYFLIRYAFNIVYILAIDWYQKFMVQQIVCTVLVLLVAICWPYKKEMQFLNYVDLLIFGNLTIINAISFYVYYRLHGITTYTHKPSFSFKIQYVLVFLPLVYMIFYCGWKLIGERRRGQFKRWCKRIKNAIQKREGLDSDDFDSSADHGQLDLSVSTGRVRGHCNRVRIPPTSSEVVIESSEYDRAESGDETLIVRSRARNTYRATRREGGAKGRSQSLLHSCGTIRKNTDSELSSSHASHTDLQQHRSPLVPILSVENEPKNYGATD